MSRNILQGLFKCSHGKIGIQIRNSSRKSWLNGFRGSADVSQSQSGLLSTNQTVYELQMHCVQPQFMSAYLNDFNDFLTCIAPKDTDSKLVGSWTCEIGDQDTAYHLWEFKAGYPGMDKHYNIYRTEKEFIDYRKKRNEMLSSRKNTICLPFSFWPTIKPFESEGKARIYELRSYTLKPGAMIEWGNHWARAMKTRSKESGVAGLFSHIGELHVVHHLWAFNDLEHRSQCRDDAWNSPGWSDCVRYTVPLIRHMKCNILQPTPFSKLR